VNRYDALPYWNLPVAIPGYIEGILVAGFGAKIIADLLTKTGVLGGLKIAEEQQPVPAPQLT
jgi:hypothetical protein